MIRYLVKLTPIGVYTFGTDQNYPFPGENYGKPSYIAETNLWPEQTTILGMLRYEILRNKSMIKDKNDYTCDELKKIEAIIGSDGFDFSSSANTLGLIEGISPVFLMKEDGGTDHILIKTPFNHINIEEKDSLEYEPICMNETLITSYGDSEGIKVPGVIEIEYEGKKKTVYQYNAKKGYTRSFLDIDTGKLDKEDVFNVITRTGNWIDGTVQGNNGLFKIRQVLIKEGYAFGVEVESSEDCFTQDSVVKMGKNGSLFKAEFKKLSPGQDSFEDKVAKALCSNPTVKKRDEIWYYALSDLVLENTQYRKFCIVEEKSIRNIGRKGKRSFMRQNLVRSGSVFFEDEPLLTDNDSLRKIGYNRVIKISALEG
ncbi:MAG: hypothetical protein IKP88_17605 [Lachnospiraceae bacterium]|nr:hypothetical protein [Lachnospiraceae bacterium]